MGVVEYLVPTSLGGKTLGFLEAVGKGRCRHLDDALAAAERRDLFTPGKDHPRRALQLT